MPTQRSQFGLSKSAIRNAMKVLAIGKASGYQRVTILGAISRAGRSKILQLSASTTCTAATNAGTRVRRSATTSENAGRSQLVRSDAASVRGSSATRTKEAVPRAPGTLISVAGLPAVKAAAAT
eukprot:6664090-Prymnesium_polylepis.1